MINWLRRALLSRIYRKTIKQNSVGSQKESSKKLNIISVILDHRLGIDKEHFNRIGSHFDIPRKNVRVLTFFPIPKSKSVKPITPTVVLPKTFQAGSIKWSIIDFCNENSDVLINFYDKDDINLKYLSAKSNRKLSVGFRSVDHALNDLIIEVDAQNIDVFISECIKYLEIFFTNKK